MWGCDLSFSFTQNIPNNVFCLPCYFISVYGASWCSSCMKCIKMTTDGFTVKLHETPAGSHWRDTFSTTFLLEHELQIVHYISPVNIPIGSTLNVYLILTLKKKMFPAKPLGGEGGFTVWLCVFWIIFALHVFDRTLSVFRT